MYAWIWRHLPGPWWVRILEALVLLAGVAAALDWVVFPWVDGLLAPWQAVTVR